MFRHTIAAVAVLFATPVLAQDVERMDEVVSADADQGTFMGAALVAIGDDIVFDEAYGSANLEWNIANTPAAKFRIGSVTKQFTAASILLLKERGLIDLDAPVKTYWPDAPPAWDAITVRNLLQHTSGITNVTNLDEFATVKFLPTTREELIARFADKPLEFTPGEKWDYSNSGYVLLSAIVEQVSGQDYADFVKANIFDPLGMADTAIDVTADIVPRRASGYAPSADGIVNAEYVNMAIPTGAGALYSTTHDLLKWQRALFGGRLLEPASLTEMTGPGVPAMAGATYGFGVLRTEDEDGTMIWHGGGIEGFNAMLMHDPDRDITVVVLANLNGGQANDLGRSLLQLARGGEVILPSERAAAETDVAALDAYEGTYALSPSFKIKVFVEDGKLMTQATGQAAFELFAQEGEEDFFFLKVVDAQLRFNRDAAGDVRSLTLYQNGQEITGTKE
ncbi:serine hydrolase [Citromicrobium bathyomarinum]|uniref:serine hydrolase n=1 Tax=Citromicrobium bathyomarinum TaxID=72174 RepID=UPI00315A81A1